MKLGFIVNNLGPSQLAYYLVRNANKILAGRTDLDIVAFIENIAKPCVQPRFATMQIFEAFGYSGTVIATSLSSAERLLQFPHPCKKILYVWDLEWLRKGPLPFRDIHSIYGNPNLTLIARSADHARMIEFAWNRSVSAVVDDFDMEKIISVAGSD